MLFRRTGGVCRHPANRSSLSRRIKWWTRAARLRAESLIRKDGAGRFRSFSMGSQPKGEVNPFILKVLKAANYPIDGTRLKSWLEFAKPRRPRDGLLTVCDNAGETCAGVARAAD